MTVDTDTSHDQKFSIFQIGNALCGIDILLIQEINKNFDITRVPGAEDFVDGIVNLRGRIVTIIDSGKKLSLAPVDKNKDNRNIIISKDEEYIGLRVDAIQDVVQASPGEIEPAPANIGSIKGSYFSGVLKTARQLIGILDIDEVLRD